MQVCDMRPKFSYQLEGSILLGFRRGFFGLKKVVSYQKDVIASFRGEF